MSIATERRPPPPSSRPPPPPPIGEEGSDISASDYRERLRSKSRARTNRGSSDVESELKKNSNDLLVASKKSDASSLSSEHTNEIEEGKRPTRNKVKLLQPPDGFTLMDLDNDLLKRRFKNRAEKFYSPVVLLTDGLYTTSSTKYALVEDKAQEIGLVIHINVQEGNDPDSNLSQCERLIYNSNSVDGDIDHICTRIYKSSIKSDELSRKASLIRYDSKTSEDIVAIIAGAYLMKYCNLSVQEAYSTLKSKLLSTRKDKFNSKVYLKLVEINDSSVKDRTTIGHLKNFLKNNVISLSLNWIPLFIIGLLFAVYFRGVIKLVYAYLF